MGIVGFFRRGGRIIPIIKKTGVGSLARSQKAVGKASGALKAARSKVDDLYKKSDELMEVSKSQKKLRDTFPNERVSGSNEAKSIQMWHSATLKEPRVKSLSDRLNSVKGMRKKAAKKAAKEVGAAGAVGVAGYGAYSYKKSKKR